MKVDRYNNSSLAYLLVLIAGLITVVIKIACDNGNELQWISVVLSDDVPQNR